MQELDNNFSEFLANPFTEYFLYLLSENAKLNIMMAADHTKDMSSTQTMKLLGFSQGTDMLKMFIENEKAYINDKIKTNG